MNEALDDGARVARVRRSASGDVEAVFLEQNGRHQEIEFDAPVSDRLTVRLVSAADSIYA